MPELPLRAQVDPIRAEKAAHVCMTPSSRGRAHFDGVGIHADYGPDAVAECRKPGILESNHEAPALGCTCGFYAFGEEHENRPELQPGLWRLEVELSGRIIRHKLGYRAQRQRVLRAIAPAACATCGKWARFLAISCRTSVIAGYCIEHARDPDNLAVDVAQVAGFLGCEVAGWYIRPAAELELAAPPPMPPAPPLAIANQAEAAGLSLLARLIADELPTDSRVPNGQWMTLQLPTMNASMPLRLEAIALADRLELRLIDYYGSRLWARQLFYAPDPTRHP